ncbi:MAG: hypothetical protein AAB451_00775 [Patescibacteria group bacterium]
MFRIGVFTSAWDQVAWELVNEISKNFQLSFAFVSRDQSETRFGDLMIRNIQTAGIPLVTFSSLRFKPEKCWPKGERFW